MSDYVRNKQVAQCIELIVKIYHSPKRKQRKHVKNLKN